MHIIHHDLYLAAGQNGFPRPLVAAAHVQVGGAVIEHMLTVRGALGVTVQAEGIPPR